MDWEGSENNYRAGSMDPGGGEGVVRMLVEGGGHGLFHGDADSRTKTREGRCLIPVADGPVSSKQRQNPGKVLSQELQWPQEMAGGLCG